MTDTETQKLSELLVRGFCPKTTDEDGQLLDRSFPH